MSILLVLLGIVASLAVAVASYYLIYQAFEDQIRRQRAVRRMR